MKKILVEKVREEAKFFCDKHPDRECFTQISTMCWYGSQFDLQNIQGHLCDECIEKLYAFLKDNFTIEPEDVSCCGGGCGCKE